MSDEKDTAFPRSDDEFDPVEDFRMPLLEHLRELRTRFVYALAAIAIGIAILAWNQWEII